MDLIDKSKSVSFFQHHKRQIKSLYILLIFLLFSGGASFGFLFKFQIAHQIDNYYMRLGHPSNIRQNGFISESFQFIKNFKWNNPFSNIKDLESFDIEIKFKHLYKLYNKKNTALKLGSLISEDNDYVPAKINDQGRRISIKMRLKGDMLDHLEGKKWSFRIKTKSSDHYKGIRVFSIQHPMTRGYQWEPLFYEFLREFDILTPRYFFKNVTLNGEDIGIMAIEEHFSKEILESQSRRESVILRFDESDSRAGLLDGSAHAHSGQNAFIKPFRSSKVFKKKNLKDIYLNSISKIQLYLKGELPMGEVFNLGKMATYVAACEVWNAEHGLWWTNMRFYVNPITMLLEPIAFDNESLHFNQKVNKLFHTANLIFPFSNLMQDLDFRKLVHLKLQMIDQHVKARNLWSLISNKEESLRLILSKEFPFIFKVPLSDYQERLELLLKIDPKDMLYEEV